MAEKKLSELREDMYSALESMQGEPALPRAWRLVITDTESLSGFGLVCPWAGAHPLLDLPELGRDTTGVYDCCPHVVETFSCEVAAFMVALLNTDTEMSPPGQDCGKTDVHWAHTWRGPLHRWHCNGVKEKPGGE